LVGIAFEGQVFKPGVFAQKDEFDSAGRPVAVFCQLDFRDAYRRVSLVFRKSFPRKTALSAFAGVVLQHLPNTVFALKNGKRVKVTAQ